MAKDTKKGLGRGLSELFGDDILNNENEGELIYAPIAKVEPRAEQPRNRFDDDALQELADSIAQYGLIQPITVRRREGGFYQIIAGERRWRACRMAGLVEVPVRVIEADDRRVAELALVENLQREDLNPIEEALGYKSLIEEYGLTQEEASKSVGRSRPAIANAMRLLSLSKEVLPLVEDGTLSAGHARALLPISDPAEQLKAARAVIDGGLSVRKTEQLAAKTLKKLAEEPEAESKTDALMVDYIAETAFSITVSGALGSISQAVQKSLPRTIAPMPRIPLPQPRSRARLPSPAYFSSAARHMRVVACAPVPNSRPGSRRSGTLPTSAQSIHSGTTRSFSPISSGL